MSRNEDTVQREAEVMAVDHASVALLSTSIPMIVNPESTDSFDKPPFSTVFLAR